MIRRISYLLVLSLLSATSAFAIEGSDPVSWTLDARQNRVAHPAVQSRLDQQPAWQDFLARHGDRWIAEWDEATRTPVRFYGEGWDVDASMLADDLGAFEIGFDVLAKAGDLLGADVPLSDLQPLGVDRSQGITTVSFERTWAGLRVEGARVSVRFTDGRFVMGQLESMPGISQWIPQAPSVTASADQALSWALEDVSWGIDKTEVLAPAELVVLPLLGELSVQYRLAFRVELRAVDHPSHRLVWVDARTGEGLAWEELVRFTASSVRAEIDDRYPGNGTAEVELVYVDLESADGPIPTDGSGNFDLPEGLLGELSFTAGSRWWRMSNAAAGEGMASFDFELPLADDVLFAAPDPELGDAASRRVLAQLGAHHSAHVVRDRALAINPDFPWAQDRADIHVNSTEATCNAWFDGDINFVQQGGGCNNTGRVSDVVFHEYGHGFHGYSIIQGVGAFDGALSEGLGDYMAATITGDPATARGFFVGSDAPLRDIAPNHVWPDDIGEIHYTGIIIAGALWDLRTALVAEYGAEVGVPMADDFFWSVAMRATDVPTSYAEVLLRDDDNGNLADGTPNKCLIDDSFGLHGLGPAAAGAPLFAVDHDAPTGTLKPGADLPIVVSAELARPDCTAGDIGEVVVHWSHDATDHFDDFESVVLQYTGATDYEGLIPGAPDGTLVRWYIEVFDTAGQLAGNLPVGSVTDPWFAAWTGDWTVVYAEDFEASDGNFTHRLISGPDNEGADDWQWGTPAGLSGDPDFAASGDRAWGNDLAMLDNWNGAYQPEVHNILESPVIEIGPADAVQVQFRRWLTVEDGFWDRATVSVNGTEIWTQRASPSQDDSSAHHNDTHWAFRSYDVTDLVSSDGTIRIEWELTTDGGLQLGGWNLDDVRVVARTTDAVAADEEPIDGGFEGSGCSCDASTGSAPGATLGLLLAIAGLGGLRRRRDTNKTGPPASVLLALAAMGITTFAITGSADAASIVAWDVPEMTSHSEYVVEAQVLEVRSELADDGSIFTRNVLSVDSYLKGDGPPRLEVLQPGGVVGERAAVLHGDLRLVAGQRVVLFARGSAPILYSTLLGWSAFRVDGVGDDALLHRNQEGLALFVRDAEGNLVEASAEAIAGPPTLGALRAEVAASIEGK